MFESFIEKTEKEKINHPEYYTIPVILIRDNGTSISFENIYEAYLCTNITKENILNCCIEKKYIFIDGIRCTFKFT